MDYSFFSSDRFVPRGRCGFWIDGMDYLYVISQMLIFAAYITIALILFLAALSKDQSKVDLSPLDKFSARLTYSAFILLCGIGHLEGPLSFAWPNYHVFAIWHCATALVSWWAVFVTIKLRVKLVTGI